MEGTDLIEVRGLKLKGRHGVTDEERADAQAIEVSLAIRLDTREAATFDDINATLDYAEAVTQVTKIVEGESFQLIETLADHIARQILSNKRALDVWVRVSKPDVNLPVDEVAVEISRSREDMDDLR
ncbi:MAG TPA: dihydroneopterin aldolase [Actinomycetota bacterium]|nr:dihydroneopterin aldolase [Actinomycetota bacterium]